MFIRVGKSLLTMAFILFSSILSAHPIGPRGEIPLEWQTEQISRVIGGGVKDSSSRIAVIEGKRCIVGNDFSFNVRDNFAFDIDEDVRLKVDFFLPEKNIPAYLAYDKSDNVNAISRIEIPAKAGVPWRTEEFLLNRARFANRGHFGSDFTLGVRGEGVDGEELTVCGVSLVRSYSTPVPHDFGTVIIDALDENGRPTPVRAGIYDKQGRLQNPDNGAIALRYFNDIVRTMTLASYDKSWPIENKSIFYIDGQYQAKLPVGRYEVVLSKGLEYRFARQFFDVASNQVSRIRLKLQRWDNLQAKGWYSGDDHVHYSRESAADDTVMLKLAQAEDLQVANILQMGNSGNVYFRQYKWETVRGLDRVPVLVPGQEDPRSSRRGHTIHLNLREPVHDPDNYLQYHEVFKKTRKQGAVVGYAHVWDGERGYEGMGHLHGMAIDVPFDLVDFAEVMNAGLASTGTWFDFLNLGYKITPTAGSDFPYVSVPGSVRCYVYAGSLFKSQAWFDGLKAGRVFVTTGPMLEMSVNRAGIGSELNVKQGERMVLNARATINPDIDRLTRLELIEQGTVIKTVAAKDGVVNLDLHHEFSAAHGTWFVIRAYGTQKKEEGTVAMSAPIYISVNGKGFWKPSAVPSIVARMRSAMQVALESGNEDKDIELWDTRLPNKENWPRQKMLLALRVQEANKIYDDLERRAALAVVDK